MVFCSELTMHAGCLYKHDMVSLHIKIPGQAQEFDMGMFVVHKSRWVFSAMAIEQNNANVKDEGVRGVEPLGLEIIPML